MKTVAATNANRHFSRIIREVTWGEAFVVTSRGQPVATIDPVLKNSAERQGSKAALLARLRNQNVTGTRLWSRDELYEDCG